MKLAMNKKLYFVFIALIVLIIAIYLIITQFNLFKEDKLFLEVNLSDEQISKYNERIKNNFEYLELFPNDYSIYLDLGNIERSLGNASQAIEYYTHAWELIPTNSTPWLNMGNLYIQLGMYYEAEEAFLKAMDIRDNYYLSYYNLAKLYKNYLKEKQDQVRSVYLEGLDKTGNDFQLLYHFTVYLEDIKNYSEAILYLNNYVEHPHVEPASRKNAQKKIEELENLIN